MGYIPKSKLALKKEEKNTHCKTQKQQSEQKEATPSKTNQPPNKKQTAHKCTSN
jgi:hypothetical protein